MANPNNQISSSIYEKKNAVLQRFHVFNLHDKNTDINFNYHFEPNKGWLEIFLNSKI
jgi:hypothetical protein